MKQSTASTQDSFIIQRTGKWTIEEQQIFLRGIQLHPKQWKKIAEMVKSRKDSQVRSHAQKYENALDNAKEKKDIYDVDLSQKSDKIETRTLTRKTAKENARNTKRTYSQAQGENLLAETSLEESIQSSDQQNEMIDEEQEDIQTSTTSSPAILRPIPLYHNMPPFFNTSTQFQRLNSQKPSYFIQNILPFILYCGDITDFLPKDVGHKANNDNNM